MATSLSSKSYNLFDNDGLPHKPLLSRSSSISLASKRYNVTSTAATKSNVAVMRHLRSIVESMAANNTLPPSAFNQSSDKKVANNFEQLPQERQEEDTLP